MTPPTTIKDGVSSWLFHGVHLRFWIDQFHENGRPKMVMFGELTFPVLINRRPRESPLIRAAGHGVTTASGILIFQSASPI